MLRTILSFASGLCLVMLVLISVGLAAAWQWPGDMLSLASKQLLDVRTGVLIDLEVPPMTQIFSHWSSDGRYLALVGWRENQNHLYMLNILTREEHNLTLNSSPRFNWVAYPAWSPDSQQIAFMGSTKDEEATHLYLVRPGARVRQITPQPLYMAGGYLSWSPDSQQIAFVAFVANEQRNPRVCIVTLAEDTLHCPITGEQPAWSPDGARLAYKQGGIHVYDLHTGQTQELTSAGEAPTWSPDGTHIAYMRWENVIGAGMWEQQLHVMAADGAQQRVVARPVRQEWSIPTWSWDSRRLFTVQADGRTLQITDVLNQATRTLRFRQLITFPAVRPLS